MIFAGNLIVHGLNAKTNMKKQIAKSSLGYMATINILKISVFLQYSWFLTMKKLSTNYCKVGKTENARTGVSAAAAVTFFFNL